VSVRNSKSILEISSSADDNPHAAQSLKTVCATIPFLAQRIVIRAFKELLLRMRIAEIRAMLGQLPVPDSTARSPSATASVGQPCRAAQSSQDSDWRRWWRAAPVVLQNTGCPYPPSSSDPNSTNRTTASAAFRPLAIRSRPRQFQHRSGTRSVVGPLLVDSILRSPVPEAQMIPDGCHKITSLVCSGAGPVSVPRSRATHSSVVRWFWSNPRFFRWPAISAGRGIRQWRSLNVAAVFPPAGSSPK